MRKLITMATLLAACAYVQAQGIHVYKSNGEVVSYLNAEVDSIVAFPTDCNGREAVDLGLSVRWASCNIGAQQPEEYGDYYAWGDTETKDIYASDNSHTRDISYPSLHMRGITDASGSLTSRYDAARQLWGGTWRMPTAVEQAELRRSCQWEWTESNGVAGYRVTGANGNSIFLPAAGYRRDRQLTGDGEVGYYWSSTAYRDYSSAESLFFYNGRADWYNDDRHVGLVIRPVAE